MALLLAGLLPAPGRAQTAVTGDASATRSPSWALLFQIDRRFTLRSFEGFLVALERTRGPESALRLGVRLQGGGSDQDASRAVDTAGHRDVDEQNADVDNVVTSLELLYVRYRNPESKLHLYWSCGPQAGLGRLEQDITYGRTADAETRTDTHTIRSTAWSVGILAGLGVRWNPTQSLGLLAEYTLIAAATFTRATDTRSSTRPAAASFERHGHDFFLGRSNTNFGLALRF